MRLTLKRRAGLSRKPIVINIAIFTSFFQLNERFRWITVWLCRPCWRFGAQVVWYVGLLMSWWFIYLSNFRLNNFVWLISVVRAMSFFIYFCFPRNGNIILIMVWCIVHFNLAVHPLMKSLPFCQARHHPSHCHLSAKNPLQFHWYSYLHERQIFPHPY